MSELGNVTRDGLIAGDYPTKAQEITITGPVEFKRGDVIGESEDGAYALVDSTKEDGTQNVVGIICDDIAAADGEEAVANMYIKGEFAHRFLRYGGTDTTDTHRRRMTEIGLIVRNTKVEGGAH